VLGGRPVKAQTSQSNYWHFSVLDQAPFFGGDRWDMADFMVACVLFVLTRLKLELTAYPKLDAWLTASINRPAAQVAHKLRES
jgi:glutathione S-transferase